MSDHPTTEPEPPVMVPSSACASCGHDADEHADWPGTSHCAVINCPCAAFLPDGVRE